VCCCFFSVLQIGKERARHAALVLNLLAAQALLASGQVRGLGAAGQKGSSKAQQASTAATARLILLSSGPASGSASAAA
jgi:hypothetical protein